MVVGTLLLKLDLLCFFFSRDGSKFSPLMFPYQILVGVCSWLQVSCHVFSAVFSDCEMRLLICFNVELQCR